ncbi:MAG TPA: DUF5683 domain-containing protein [Acidobacteriota bacterium]|nr:DUF5683 domain-containing protein [Acidobacteriota bacterium]
MKTTHHAYNLILTAAALLLVTIVVFDAAPVAAAVSRPGGSLADLRTRVPAANWSVGLTALSDSTGDLGPLLAQTDVDLDRRADVYDFEQKSPRRAFLQSFLIPGWGQYYVRSAWWKPVLFLGAELASWYGVSHFHGSGLDREDEYKAYADDHWDPDKYLEGLWTVYYYNSVKPDSIDSYLDTITPWYTVERPDAPDSTVYQPWSHHAFYHPDGTPVEKNEYYENVGKYHQFNFGWDDYPGPTDPEFPESPRDTVSLRIVTENRDTYLHMRADANTEYKRATKMLVVVVANHLVSGIEAALGARRYNRSRDEFGTVEAHVRFVMSPTTGRPMPRVTLGYRF